MTIYWHVPTATTRKKLDKVFNRFAGKEVQIYQDKNGHLQVSKGDTVLKELESDITGLGLKTRLIFPGSMQTQDARPDRVNIFIGPDFKDGKFHVPSTYSMG